MKLADQLYMVRYVKTQIKALPNMSHMLEPPQVYYKTLANKRDSQPGLYQIRGAHVAGATLRKQLKDNEYFTYEIDVVPVEIIFGKPIKRILE